MEWQFWSPILLARIEDQGKLARGNPEIGLRRVRVDAIDASGGPAADVERTIAGGRDALRGYPLPGQLASSRKPAVITSAIGEDLAAQKLGMKVMQAIADNA